MPVESSVISLSFDSNNTLWVGLKGYNNPLILLYDKNIWKNTTELYNGGEPSEIVFDRFGNTWVSSVNSGGLAKYNGAKWKYYRRDNSAILWDQASSLAIDSTGVLWCGTPFGACTYDGENWKYYRSSSGLPYEQVNKIIVDGNNRWIATDHFGLVKYDGNTWQAYDKTNSGIPFNDVNDIAFDSQKRIWVGTGNGFGVFDGENWTTYNEENTGYLINNIWDIEIDSKDKVWLTSFDKSTLFSFDGTNWQYFNSTNSILPKDFNGHLGIDRNDRIWFGTNDGFFIYDGISWVSYNAENSLLPDNWVQCFAFDSTGNSWVGTANGILRINGEEWEVFNPNNSGMIGWDVDDIAIDSKNNVWAGFFWDQGISKYNGLNWENYNNIFDPALGGIDALSIDFDKEGNLWIGTLLHGLLQFNEDKIVSVVRDINTLDKIEQNVSIYPNPFNSQTNINFTLTEASYVGLKFYSIIGEFIASQTERLYPTGNNSIKFNGEDLASGVYLCSLEIISASHYNKQIYTKKLLLIK